MSVAVNEVQADVLRRLKAAGFDAKWWGRNGGPVERLYMQVGRRDAKVFFTFDEPADVRGSALKVFIDDCGQPPAWYVGQKRKLFEYYAGAAEIVKAASSVGGPDQMIAPTLATKERIEAAIAAGKPVRLEYRDTNEGWLVITPLCFVNNVVSTVRGPEDQEVLHYIFHEQCGKTEGAGKEESGLYMWRGCLRYGSGAEPLHFASLQKEN